MILNDLGVVNFHFDVIWMSLSPKTLVIFNDKWGNFSRLIFGSLEN